jgi:alpha-glucosidase
LVLRRSDPDGAVLAVFNLSDTAADWPAVAGPDGSVLAAVNGAALGLLPAFGAILIEERT